MLEAANAARHVHVRGEHFELLGDCVQLPLFGRAHRSIPPRIGSSIASVAIMSAM